MKKILFIISLVAATTCYATHPPNEARDAVTKALTTESWTLDQTRVGQNVMVLDSPTERKQIIMFENIIAFIDLDTGQITRSDSVLHNQFYEDTLNTFGSPAPEIPASLTDWVDSTP